MSYKCVLTAALLGAGLLAGGANAGSLLIGFEAGEGYTVGNINGQQGWSKTGPYDSAVAGGGVGINGSAQALRISNAVTSGSFGDQTFTPHIAPLAGETAPENLFELSWYFKPVTPTPQNGLFISVSPDNGLGGRMSYIGMGEDATNGLNLIFYDWQHAVNGGHGDFVMQQLNTNMDPTVWHRVDLNVEFLSGPGNDVVDVFVDGVHQWTGTSWEDYYRYGPVLDGGGGGIFNINSTLFAARGDAANTLNNGFYIDNVSLTSTPEPGTIGLLLAGLGGLVAVARRRRKA